LWKQGFESRQLPLGTYKKFVQKNKRHFLKFKGYAEKNLLRANTPAYFARAQATKRGVAKFKIFVLVSHSKF
jgi:hypothetical protein